MDHRHNFSAYFYPIYLQMFREPLRKGFLVNLRGIVDQVVRHPLASFIPQFSLAVGAGLLLPATSVSITFTWFIQTVVFVAFNKVCTSQVSNDATVERRS
jgi:phosphatidylinositol glycan class M